MAAAAPRCVRLAMTALLGLALGQTVYEPTCNKNWVSFGESCYKFTRSPSKSRQGARDVCQSFSADLLSVNSMEEHTFVISWLRRNDPLQQQWFMSARQQTSNIWINDGDSSSLVDGIFLSSEENVVDRNFAAYVFSKQTSSWGLKKVTGSDAHLYICEIKKRDLKLFAPEERDHAYGLSVTDSKLIPRGPRMVLQPLPAVFDPATRSTLNDITIKCLADGYPHVTYEWYKQTYVNDRETFSRVDPLQNERITISGGALMISNPDQTEDRGQYQCRARNQFGTIVSESVLLSFAMIGEFNQDRATETGFVTQGKAISCDAPQTFPDAKYQWSRDYFGNFVKEDSRVFASQDGLLYFSSLEIADSARFMCSVRTSVSKDGKNGPLFRLELRQSSSPESLRFAQNFPVVFPESPQEGGDVRFECMAFGYPTPTYSWSRVDGQLPLDSELSSENRVLTLKHVTVSDQGQYACTITNKQSLQRSVTLSIQAKPRFTIPLDDQHVNENSELSWVCEAFGMPDVTYSWLRNGEVMNPEDLVRDRRVQIRDSQLTIRNVTQSDQAMYQCRASNQLATSYSSAQLRVLHFPPSFAKRPLPTVMFAGLGRNLTIPCRPEAAPSARIEWLRNGQKLGTGGRLQVLPNGYLRLDPIQSDDGGVYSCVATNALGKDTSSGTLSVLAPPVFKQRPQERKVSVVDQWISLQCRAEADDSLDLAYVWTHNGLPVDYRKIDTPYHRVANKIGSLEIRNISLQDAGEYSCIARTTVGEVATTSQVIVAGPPEAPGGVKVFRLNSTSGTLQWQDYANHGREISMYRVQARTNWMPEWFTIADNITVDRNALSLSDQRQYVFPNSLVPNSRYEFLVSAVNTLGYSPYSPASPSYRTAAAPPFIAPFHIISGGGMRGDLTIEWQSLPEQYRNADGVYYKVFWKRHGINPESNYKEKNLKEFGDIDHFVVVVGRKYFYTEYKVKLQAFNSLGAGPVSEEHIIRSAEGIPKDTPTNIAVRPYNSTALNVSWTGVKQDRESVRGQLLGYRVKYWPVENDEDTDSLILLSRGESTSVLVVGLQPFTRYYAEVMVYNSAGSGQESQKELGRTFKMAPQNPPTAVQVSPIDPSTVEVTWRFALLSAKEEALRGYKVRVWERDQDMSKAVDTVVLKGGRALLARVTGLHPGQTYKVRVLAFSLGGDGTMSSPAWTIQMGDPDKLRGVAGRLLALDTSVGLLAPLVLAMAWLHRNGLL